jgi:hypothetical protein
MVLEDKREVGEAEGKGLLQRGQVEDSAAGLLPCSISSSVARVRSLQVMEITWDSSQPDDSPLASAQWVATPRTVSTLHSGEGGPPSEPAMMLP